MWQSAFGSAEPIRAILTTTATTTIIPAVANILPLAKVHLCNVTAGAVVFDIEVFDGTTSFYLEKGRSLAANSSYELRDEILQNGHSLRAKAGAANAIHVSVIKSLPVR